MKKPTPSPKSTRNTRTSKSVFNKTGQETFFSSSKEPPTPFFSTSYIQPKLIIGDSQDQHEQEADQLGEKVAQKLDMKKSPVSDSPSDSDDQSSSGSGESPPGDPNNSDSSGISLQRKEKSGGGMTVSAELTSRLQQSQGQGQELSPDIQREMGEAFDSDFSSVKIHNNNESEAFSKQLNARAFTYGQDIYFNQGEYDPNSNRGRRLLAHELTHVVQQGGDIIRRQDHGTTEEERTPDESLFRTLDLIAGQAEQRGVSSRAREILNTVNLKIFVTGEYIYVLEMSNDQIHTFPHIIRQSSSGFYLIRFQSSGNDVAFASDIEHGRDIQGRGGEPGFFQSSITTGRERWLSLISGRTVLIHVAANVIPRSPEETEEDEGGFQNPDTIVFEFFPHEEISQRDFQQLVSSLPSRSLAVVQFSPTIFEPDTDYGHPYNFRYHTHSGDVVFLSRSIQTSTFYYVVNIDRFTEFIRIYPLHYAGVSALPTAIVGQMMVEMAMTFIPVVGPLFALALTARDVYHASEHWDEMSSWEKTLLGIQVLFDVIQVGRFARGFVRGTRGYRQGVQALMNSGVTRSEASRLMLASAVFQSERSTGRIVASLWGRLRSGARLTAAEVAQIERILEQMVQRLPAAERAAITASMAGRTLETASSFLNYGALTARQLHGFRQLSPKMALILQRMFSGGRRVEAFAIQILDMAAESQHMARGIDHLETALLSHVTNVNLSSARRFAGILNHLGPEVIRDIGRYNITIPDELAGYVRRMNASRAAEALLRGRRGRNPIEGLGMILRGSSPRRLTTEQLRIQNQFGNVFLSNRQLRGMENLSEDLRNLLARVATARGASAATAREIRAIAENASQSSLTASVLDQLGEGLINNGLRPQKVVSVLTLIDPALLERVGASQSRIDPQLIAEVARVADRGRLRIFRNNARELLLSGIERSTGGRIPGIIDIAVSDTRDILALRGTLPTITNPDQAARYFARWVIRHPDQIPGVSTVLRHRPGDAEMRLKALFQQAGGDLQHTQDILDAIRDIERTMQSTGSTQGLGTLIANLSGGGTTTFGSNFVLNFVSHRLLGQERLRRLGFEVATTRNGVTRNYDVVMNGILEYELKNLSSFTGHEPFLELTIRNGRRVGSHAWEFERDIMMHLDSGFEHLRWVYSGNLQTSRPAIANWMRAVLASPSPQLRRFLDSRGIPVDRALETLDRALHHGELLSFH